MAERFDISVLEGTLEPSTVGDTTTKKRGGITVTIHDRAYLHRVVRLYRSEDFGRRPRVKGGRPRSREQALAEAEAECSRLNAKYPEGWPAA